MIGTLEGFGPDLILKQSAGVLQVRGASAIPSVGVAFPTIGGVEAIRLADADITLRNAVDITAGRAFTIAAWINLAPGRLVRTIVTRQQGATQVSLQVSPNGVPEVVVTSAAGGHRAVLSGASRVDNSQWHLVGVTSVAYKGSLLGVTDYGGLRLRLWAGGEQVATTVINPGLFGVRPDLSMDSPVFVGRAPDGSAPLAGAVGVVAGWRSALSGAAWETMAGAVGADRRPRMFWGVPFG